MTTYRARACPKCRYYVGYSITQAVQGTPESAVKSFCLNCNYQLPVRAVVRGMKNSSPWRRTAIRAQPPQKLDDSNDAARGTAPARAAGEAPVQRANYSRELRAIGQELERRGFTTFNLKCSGDGYFVWSTEIIRSSQPSEAGTRSSYRNPDNPTTKMLIDRIVGVLFDPGTIARLERAGMQNRRRGSGASNGRRLSHLLRTVGEQVYRRNQRLLAIAWQENQISVVAEGARGRREISVLRSDNLYDLWVRMYLQRSR
jgi:hypothetical protein